MVKLFKKCKIYYMRVFQTVIELQSYLLEIKNLANSTVGFVPTMGALHAGHISLIEKSNELADITVCSIFVNPTQFNDKKDFERYPIQIDRDIEMLIQANCDVAFIPDVEEIYPAGAENKTLLDLGFVGQTLEAEHRPGHFEGVVQVVKRLLEIVQPDFLFLGQKDYQQCMVITKLVEVFHFPVKVIICDTLRERDGLAMSSRNVRLSPEARQAAVKLSKSLYHIKNELKRADLNSLLHEENEKLNADPLISVEYLKIINGKTLEAVDVYSAELSLAVLIAAKVGEVRLIDNMILQ